MPWQITFPSVLLYLTSALGGLCAWLVWRRRKLSGGAALFLALLAMTEWNFATATEAISIRLADKIVWSQVEYLGAATSAPFFLLFALTLTRHKPLTLRLAAPLLVLPAAIILLACTNASHNLIWTAFTPVSPPSLNLYVYHHGPAYWVYVFYDYLCVGAAVLLFLKAYFNAVHIQRRQYAAILLGSVFPLVGGLLYVAGLPVPGFNTAAFSFSFTAVIYVYALSSYNLLDLVPVARNILLDHMQDGILVFDPAGRILDINPACRAMLRLEVSPIGQDLTSALRLRPELQAVLDNPAALSSEVQIADPYLTFLDVRLTPIQDISAHTVAWFAILRDITAQKGTHLALLEKSRQMEHQAITDPLTGLYNRRYVQEYLAHFPAGRNRPFTLAMFDVDDLKGVNDRFGHPAGDQALQRIAQTLQKQVRSTDILARLGGDEFLILFPNTQQRTGYAVLDRLRKKFTCRPAPGKTLPITISGGVTEWQPGEDPQLTLQRADRLLYQAKQDGKNHLLHD